LGPRQNSGIKVPEPPEPQDNFEPGAVSVVGVDIEEGTSLKQLPTWKTITGLVED
jgi:hypothetical protein